MKRSISFIAFFAVLIFSGTVMAQLTANFSATPVSGCSPIVVQFTDASTGGAVSWLWTLDNGTTSTVQNPSKTYTVPGTYSITLTVKDAQGNTSIKTLSNFITVVPKPIVGFTASDSTPGCAPKTIAFTSSVVAGVGGPLTYTWDFGDGTLSTAANPTHTYTSAGNFDVTLSVANAQGCNKSLTKIAYIKASQKPVSGFSFSGHNVCALPATVTFTNSTVGSPLTTYQWNFGNGATSTAANPSVTYAAAGTYVVRLISTVPGSGCPDTLTQNVVVTSGKPVASFTAPAGGCISASIDFNNTTTPTPTAYFWDFGDGTTSTFSSPSKSYAVAGTYNVRLVIQSANGCTDTLIKSISIAPIPVPSFSISPQPAVGCSVPKTFTFTNTSTGATSYSWGFGDGTSSSAVNPSKTYTSFGNYSVVLTAVGANTCAGSTGGSIIALTAPSLSVTASYPGGQCVPASVNFTNSFSALDGGTTYSWSFGDGTNGTGAAPSHNYATAGTYTVTLTATSGSGCVATTTTTVNVGTKPTASFTGSPVAVCVNSPVSFNNTSTGGLTYNWSFGDGGVSGVSSPNYAYGVPGTYSVRLIVSNYGCNDTVVRPGYITVIGPVAQFSDNFSCVNKSVHTFTNSSTGATSYSWDFGDGSAGSTLVSPSHTYGTTGSFDVKLTAMSGGCSSVSTKRIYIYNLSPQFSGSPLPVCKGQPVVFTPQVGLYVRYVSWDFGDGTGSGVAQPIPVSKVYNSAGLYDVSFYVTDSLGCVDTVRKAGYVNVRQPIAGFKANPLNGCPGTPIQFTDTSTISGGGLIVSRNWTFGDGTTLGGNNGAPSKTYGASGIYDVKLQITYNNGCTDSVFRAAYINVTKPVAAFSSARTNRCSAQSITLSNTSVDGVSYDWDFGDGTVSTATNPVKVYAVSGSYSVRLIATATSGCKDTIIRTVAAIFPDSFALFSVSDSVAFCPPLSVQFSTPSVPGNTYLWNFGNGSTSTSGNASTLYSTAGTFIAKLIVTNALGCVDSATKTIKVNGPAGTISYTPLSGCSPLPVTFTVNGANTTSYTFDFDNGVTQTTNSNTLTYTYLNGGAFNVGVILSNGAGCTIAIQAIDTLKVSSLNAGFTASANSLCLGRSVQFVDTSVSKVGGMVTRMWDFGDGTTATTANPSKTYTLPGVYTVKLRLSNGVCMDSITKIITVLAQPVQTVVASNSTLCPGNSATLTASGASTYLWTPAATLSCTTCPNPTASPAGNTTYTVVGTGANGCSDTDQVTIVVAPNPTVSAGPDVSVCPGTSTPLAATGAATYVWSPAAGLSCTNCPNPTASPAVTTTYVVTGTSVAGCIGKDTIVVTIAPSLVLTTNGPKTICAGGSTALTVTGATSYVWSPATGLSCTNCPNPTASPASTTTYTIVGNSPGGCSGTTTLTVTVNPLPVVSVSPATSAICAGGSTALTASGATSYVWSPAAGLSCTTCPNPTATPAVTTTYTVTGTGANGCINTATALITVNPLPVVSVLPNAPTICAGASTSLVATGAASYVWSPATGLSCTTCPNPTASPASTTTYTVVGTGANSCTATATVVVTVNPLPVVTASASQLDPCIGTPVTLNAGGATTYVWSPATGLSCTTCPSPSATPTVTTTYTVTGTNGAGCTATAQITITPKPLPVLVTVPATICVGGSAPLTVTGATSYVWSPTAGLSCTTCPNPTASPASTTTYTVVGTGANGCTATTTALVTVNPLPVVSAGPDVSVCPGTSTPLAATGAASYVWSPAAGLSCTNCPNPTASPAVTTTYIVTGTSASGCIGRDTIVVTIAPSLVLTTNGPKTICAGGSTALTVTGATSYVWSPATGLSCTTCPNPTASPASTTTYTIVGSSPGGCSGTTTLTVTINPLPVVSVSPASSVICAGASTALTASGATSYVWSPAAGLSCTTCPNPTATPAVTTTYTVTGTGANGCTATTTALITVNPLPVVSAGPDVSVCPGASTPLAATGAASYVWAPATGLSCTTCPNPTASPATTSTYIVTGTSAAGCIGKDTVVVTVNPSIVLTNNGPKTICAGASTALTVSGATSYVWSPTAGLSCTTCPNPTASPASTTTYTIVGNNPGGCAGTTTLTVTVNPLPVVSVTPNPAAFCAGSSVALTATGAASYVWSPAAGLSCTACPNPTASPASTTTYTVTGTDANGCINTATVPVTVNPLPVVTATASDANPCTGTAVTLTAGGAATYVWSPATGLSCTACPNPAATPTVPTTYTVTGRTAAGCTGTAQVTITPKPVPVLVTGPAAFCAGGSAPLSVSGAASYVWSPAIGLSCTTCPNPTASPASTTTYTVTGTGANGCTATTTVLVTVEPLPVVSAGPDLDVCAGVPVTLTATGAASYVWSPAAGLSCTACASPVATLVTTATYTITGTSAAGCVDSATITLRVVPRDSVSVETPKAICEGGSVQLNATGGSSYSWSPAESLSNPGIADPLASPGVTTTYTVVIRQGNCYFDTLTTTVVVLPLPTVNAGPDQTVIAGSSTLLKVTATDATVYRWSPAASLSCADCATPNATPVGTTTYRVEVENSIGCLATDEVTVFVVCDNSQIFIPNTFTPNGDGANDVFYPRGKGVRQVLSFRIYSRWGEMIFMAENFQLNDDLKGWDGRINNVPLKPDAYVWVIDAICDTGAPLKLQGSISLIK